MSKSNGTIETPKWRAPFLRFLRTDAQIKSLYDKQDAAFDRALQLGLPLREPISVRFKVGKAVVAGQKIVGELFDKGNQVFRSKSIRRYEVSDYKPPKPTTDPKSKKAKAK